MVQKNWKWRGTGKLILIASSCTLNTLVCILKYVHFAHNAVVLFTIKNNEIVLSKSSLNLTEPVSTVDTISFLTN